MLNELKLSTNHPGDPKFEFRLNLPAEPNSELPELLPLEHVER
jgi:hypothetical protein